MKALTAALLMLMLAVTTASAQTSRSNPASSRTKVWLGVTLLTAGALILPVTTNEPVRSPRLETGVGLMAAGGVLLLWGFQEKRKAHQARKAIGVRVGRSPSLHVRWAW